MHTWAGYLNGVQMGIADYILHRPEWVWKRMLPLPDALRAVRRIEVDGVIAYIEPSYQRDVASLGVPVVDVANWHEPVFPSVLPDDQAIGRMAARHLLDLGLRHFGIYAPASAQFSRTRRASFVAALAEAGFAVSSPEERVRSYEGTATPGVSPAMANWLRRLPKPVGIMATSDGWAAEILEACRHLGIRVPEEISVLGVDNDELINRFTHPPLSSIAIPSQKIGFEAASLLDRLMSGESRPKRPICLPPLGVAARQSTNLLAIPDEDVQAAVRYIRAHVDDGVTVRDLLREVPVNRRYLERKFRQHVGRTPLQEIRRARISRVKELLSGTDMPMPEIARRGGFPNAERLATIFHKETGQTPTAYRRTFRLGGMIPGTPQAGDPGTSQAG